MLERLWARAGHLPRGVRSLFAAGLRQSPEPTLARSVGLLLDPARAQRIGEKTLRLAAALEARDGDEAAAALSVVGLANSGLVNGAEGSMTIARMPELRGRLSDLPSRMQAQDMISYLPDDILTKIDRCSMAVSLESRVPLLDHRLVELVWSLSPAIRHGKEPKALLRSVLARYVPPALFERPKRGFQCRSIDGYVDRCANGPTICCRRKCWPARACSTRKESVGCGRSTCQGGATMRRPCGTSL